MSYLETARDLYREAAMTPQPALCCAGGTGFRLPGLDIPAEMQATNYGCGTTVHVEDLSPDSNVLYLGVGGGLEALQFSYFTRRPRSVIALDPVPEMLEKARANLKLAEATNPWFRSEFVDLREGDALRIPLPDAEVDLVAQNCLFNIFVRSDLELALSEAARVLRPGGRLALSDPICDQPIPDALREDERLRARCISGALPLEAYLETIVAAGFGTIEIRARRPYRVLDRHRYGVPLDILLESIEAVAVKGPVPEDGACVFAGETVIFVGDRETFDDGKGHIIVRDVPLPVCRKTARRFRSLGRSDLIVTAPTWHYAGGGCC
jgi:SAM-dependent methyltransferase